MSTLFDEAHDILKKITLTWDQFLRFKNLLCSNKNQTVQFSIPSDYLRKRNIDIIIRPTNGYFVTVKADGIRAFFVKIDGFSFLYTMKHHVYQVILSNIT